MFWYGRLPATPLLFSLNSLKMNEMPRTSGLNHRHFRSAVSVPSFGSSFEKIKSFAEKFSDFLTIH